MAPSRALFVVTTLLSALRGSSFVGRQRARPHPQPRRPWRADARPLAAGAGGGFDGDVPLFPDDEPEPLREADGEASSAAVQLGRGGGRKRLDLTTPHPPQLIGAWKTLQVRGRARRKRARTRTPAAPAHTHTHCRTAPSAHRRAVVRERSRMGVGRSGSPRRTNPDNNKAASFAPTAA